jgi:hypothetical protein
MKTKTKIALGVGVVAAGGLAYWLWRRGGVGSLKCGPGFVFTKWTPEQIAELSKWSPAVQEQVRRWGGTCSRAGTVSEATIVDGPILYPWQTGDT